MDDCALEGGRRMIIQVSLVLLMFNVWITAEKEGTTKTKPNNATFAELEPLSSFSMLTPVYKLHSYSDEEVDSSPPSICSKYCTCLSDSNVIKCNSMKNLWSLITKGVGHEKEFEKFHIRVSDHAIEEISRRFILEKEEPNGLKKVRHLVLNDFPSLSIIHPLFFERMFPDLIHLTVTEGINNLREFTTGYLPHLQELIVNGKLLQRVIGCNDEVSYCFDPDLMERLELPTLNLENLGLPDDIGDVVIVPNNVHSLKKSDEHVFDGKVVERLKYKMTSGSNFPVSFEKITVNDEFHFELPHMDDDQMELVISDIRKNPSLYARMKIRVNKPDFKFPVYYKSCVDCDYDEMYETLHRKGTCAEEKYYLEKYNPDLNDLHTQDIIIRAIYIDIDDLIKQVKKFKPKPKYRLTVYTFLAKKPKFKTIDFDFRVFYGMLDGHSSLHQHISSSSSSSTTFSIQEKFGTSLKFAKRLDPLFVQSYSTCIAKLATDFRKNSPSQSLRTSISWVMFINLPNTGIYASEKDKLMNARASAIQSLLTRYMYMLAEDKTTLNKIPYTSIDIQRELARTLLKSAERVSEKKQNFSLEPKIDDLNDTTSGNLKAILDARDEAEVKLLESEKEKAISLISIAVKQKELFEGELVAIQDTLSDVKRSYSSLQIEFQAKSERFAEGAVARHATSWADVADEVTNSIISVVNLGKFDMSNITKSVSASGKIVRKLNSLKSVLSGLMMTQKKMKKIAKIFRKIEKVYKAKQETLKEDLRKIRYNEIDPTDMSKFSELVNKFTENIQTIEDVAEGVYTVYKVKLPATEIDSGSYTWADTLFTEEINMINPGEDISTEDIMQWNEVREKIEKLFNHRVTIQIPETGEYKASIFNMITKGKAMSQLRLDEVKLMADIGFVDTYYWQFIEEYAALGMRIHELTSVMKSRKIDYGRRKAKRDYEDYYDATEKDLYSEEFIAKMMIIEAIHMFCQSYHYDRLKMCPDKYQIDVHTNLNDATQLYRNLVLEQTVDRLFTFQPSPQHFNNIAVFIRKEENCECVKGPYATLASIEGRKTSLQEQKSFREDSIRNCFPDREKPYTEEDKSDIFDKLDNCNMNRVQHFSNEHAISFDIPFNYLSSSDSYERVRIDSVKVFLDGVKTKSGKVVMRIENSGVLQDRYKGNVFNFLGAPWIRNYEYCSRNIKKHVYEVSDELPSVCSSREFTTLVSTDTEDTVDSFYLKPTLFSTWVISVPEEHNPGLDLTRLKSIQINFSGSLLIGRSNYSLYDIYGNPPKSQKNN